MKTFIPKTRKPITSIFFLVVLLSSLFVFQVTPTKANDPHAEMVWVLTETQVNPYDGQLEFYGGGATPGWFVEARFEGTFLKYAVTETSFRIDDRWVDYEYEHHNVTIETYFTKPPLKLIPGETIELIAGFAHSGMAEDVGTLVRFWYDSEDVDIQPDTVFVYAPWADNFDGTADGTYSFKVPPASSGSEIEINAAWWNAKPCQVIWKYQAQEVGGAAEEEVVPDQQQEETAAELDPDPDENRTSSSILAGHAIAIMGDVSILSRGQEKKLFRTDSIWLGSCIKTGEDGRVRIRINDVRVDGFWVDQNIPGNPEYIQEVYREQGDLINPINSRVRGPTFINIGTNSEMCFETLLIGARQPTGLIELIKGHVRVILKGWTQNSSFNVRAGIAVCGIRGSEVFIHFNPETEFIQAQVLEGHMDVTSDVTGETVSLFDNQALVVDKGEFIGPSDLRQDIWDSNLAAYGLRDEDFPDSEIEEWEIIAADIPEDKITSAQETRSPLAYYFFFLCGVMICVGAIVVMLIIIYFVHKRSKQ